MNSSHAFFRVGQQLSYEILCNRTSDADLSYPNSRTFGLVKTRGS